MKKTNFCILIIFILMIFILSIEKIFARNYDVLGSSKVIVNQTGIIEMTDGYLSHIIISSGTAGASFQLYDSTATAGGTIITIDDYVDATTSGTIYWFKRQIIYGLKYITSNGAKINIFYKK